ncbi:helix-turn-helix domain-containing protein [Streptomyces sp. NPDC002073]
MPGRSPDRGVSVSTVLGRRLGGELLRMREALGLRQSHAAEALTASVAKVAKMERGLVPMRDPDVRALCHLYGEKDEAAVGRLLDLARLDRERRKAKGWWQHSPDAGGLAEYVAMEDVAARVRTWQLAVIPGLLQTADYARALAVSDEYWQDPDDIERIVAVRMKRQNRLGGQEPLHLHAVVWEGALRQEVGGAAVMRAQLSHLLEVAQAPNVHVQVLPFRVGGHPCVAGAFSMLSFADAGAVDVVHVDTIASTVWVESDEEAGLCSRYFDRTARMSLAPRDSVDLIDSIRKGI